MNVHAKKETLWFLEKRALQLTEELPRNRMTENSQRVLNNESSPSRQESHQNHVPQKCGRLPSSEKGRARCQALSSSAMGIIKQKTESRGPRSFLPSLEKLAGLHSYRISGFVSKRLSTALAFFSKTGFFVGAGKWIDHSFCNAAIIAGKKSSAFKSYTILLLFYLPAFPIVISFLVNGFPMPVGIQLRKQESGNSRRESRENPKGHRTEVKCNLIDHKDLSKF
ncbi:tRNA-splicing ligase RtcB homolog [Striga asiatica]|uniref:tRNA-splicing ligase RtcB homolog n=1 Tax=Striga asiatica TaxID=4170 RepID=A0A5A7R1F8_STRAF|nr:tRNA-splicing ligase RtcB homolog [Striga asiatica]